MTKPFMIPSNPLFWGGGSKARKINVSNEHFKGKIKVAGNMSHKWSLYLLSSNIFPFILSKDQVVKPAELQWLRKPKLKQKLLMRGIS